MLLLYCLHLTANSAISAPIPRIINAHGHGEDDATKFPNSNSNHNGRRSPKPKDRPRHRCSIGHRIRCSEALPQPGNAPCIARYRRRQSPKSQGGAGICVNRLIAKDRSVHYDVETSRNGTVSRPKCSRLSRPSTLSP
ncbi:hypothetical protein BDW71DRAFT_12891 [Aspergillus fruticulosus]